MKNKAMLIIGTVVTSLALLCIGEEVISLAVLMVWAAVAVAKLFLAMGKGGYFN